MSIINELIVIISLSLCISRCATEIIINQSTNREYVYGMLWNNVSYSYPCVSGMYRNFTVTSDIDCVLFCHTNQQIDCLAGNYYSKDGRCEIFEFWLLTSSATSGGMGSRTNSNSTSSSTSCASFRKKDLCPPNFTYVPTSKTCLTLLSSMYNWETGNTMCSNLGPNVFMVTVDSLDKGTNVTNYMLSIRAMSYCQIPLDTNVAWTGGARLFRQATTGSFYWFGRNNTTILFATPPWSLLQLSILAGSCVSLAYSSKEVGYLYGTSCSTSRCVICETSPN